MSETLGLGNHSGRTTFVNIKEGKLAIKKENEILLYTDLTGYLKDIQIRDDEYQGKRYKKVCLTFDCGQESVQLQMRLDSGYCRAFCNAIGNADLKLPIKISPTHTKVDDISKTGMFVNQNDKALKWTFTKDSPNGLPDLVKANFKGQDFWDNTNQQNFYIKYLMETIRPQLENSVVSGPAHQIADEATAGGDGEKDDLPF